jgi:vacuolar iron transporter family protein
VLASLTLSGLALVLIGAGTSLFTGRNIAYSAARQVLFGFAAAGITYGVGALVGATVLG